MELVFTNSLFAKTLQLTGEVAPPDGFLHCLLQEAGEPLTFKSIINVMDSTCCGLCVSLWGVTCPPPKMRGSSTRQAGLVGSSSRLHCSPQASPRPEGWGQVRRGPQPRRLRVNPLVYLLSPDQILLCNLAVRASWPSTQEKHLLCLPLSTPGLGHRHDRPDTWF